MKGKRTEVRRSLSTGQVAKMLDVAPRTISKYIDLGLLIGYRLPLSGDRRVLFSDLIDFMDRNNIPREILTPDYCEEIIHTCLCISDCDLKASLSPYLKTVDGWIIIPAADSFTVGRLTKQYSLGFAVIDSGIGREEAINAAAYIRKVRQEKAKIYFLANEDEVDFPRLFKITQNVIQKPFDLSSLASQLLSQVI